MNGFFKPLRRKIGIVTLVLACLFAALWMRSRVLYDFLYPIDIAYIIASDKTGLSLLLADDGDDQLRWPFKYVPTFYTGGRKGNALDGHPFTDKRKCLIFVTGMVLWPNGQRLRCVVIPYWSLVVPLTLLSAWLLLGKPKPSIEQQAKG